jgi:hypothetical protein
MKVQVQGHYYEANNMGDNAIEQAVLSQLSYNIDDFERVYEQPDLFILGGGGMYSDWQKEAAATWLPPIEKALANNVPVIAYGIGCGPFVNGQLAKYNSVFKNFKLLMVRDKKSAEGLDNAIVTGDPVMYKHQRTNILLNLIKIHTIKDFDKWSTELYDMLTYIGNITQCFLWPNKDQDKLYLEKPHDFIEIVKGYNLYAGMQMHGIMLSALHGVPTVALRYHHKCDLDLENIIAKCNVGDGQNWPTLDTPEQILIEIIYNLPKNLKAAAKSRLNVVILKKYMKGEDYGYASIVSDYFNSQP